MYLAVFKQTTLYKFNIYYGLSHIAVGYRIHLLGLGNVKGLLHTQRKNKGTAEKLFGQIKNGCRMFSSSSLVYTGTCFGTEVKTHTTLM